MIEHKCMIAKSKNDRQYQLFCNSDSPLNDLYDVLVEMEADVFELIKKFELQKKMQEASSESDSKSESQVEVLHE